MLVYTVHEPARPATNIEERADQIVFVKEGFSWWGFLLGPVWMVGNFLWLELLIGVVLAAALAAGLVLLGAGDRAPGAINMLFMLIVGFEGNDLKRWRLHRKGYEFLAAVAGRNFEECERRFFDAWLPHIAGRQARQVPSPVMNLKAAPQTSGDWRGPGAIGTLPGATV